MAEVKRIVELLGDWKSRKEICEALAISKNSAIHHLKTMKRDGYIESAKDKRPWSPINWVEVYCSTGKFPIGREALK